MKICSVTAHRLRIPFVAPFSHALHSRMCADTIIVRAESDEGRIGVGEILPRNYLTGETVDRVLASTLPAIVRRWSSIGLDNSASVITALRDELDRSGRDLATYAGWETAILDLAGKTFAFNAGDLLGPKKRAVLPKGVVFDFNIRTHDLERQCLLLRLSTQRHLKIKVGLSDDDIRLRIIQDVLGHNYWLRLDANAAWTPSQAIDRLQEFKSAKLNISSIEQPVHAADLVGMRTVRETTGIPVVADESLCTMQDGESLIREKAADAFNIRIAKCGGVLGSSRLVKLAEEAGLRCQLGTLVGETGVLSRVAEEFGTRVHDFEFIEGLGQNKKLLKQDVVKSEDSRTPVQYGYGIALDDSALIQLESDPSIVIARNLIPQETTTHERC